MPPLLRRIADHRRYESLLLVVSVVLLMLIVILITGLVMKLILGCVCVAMIMALLWSIDALRHRRRTHRRVQSREASK